MQKLLLFKETKPQLLKLNAYQPLPDRIQETRAGMWSRCATFAAAAQRGFFLAEFRVLGLHVGAGASLGMNNSGKNGGNNRGKAAGGAHSCTGVLPCEP